MPDPHDYLKAVLEKKQRRRVTCEYYEKAHLGGGWLSIERFCCVETWRENGGRIDDSQD
jgi:hypothetical protein